MKYKKILSVISICLLFTGFSFITNAKSNPNKVLKPSAVDDPFFRTQKMYGSKLPTGHILEVREGAAIFMPNSKTIQLAFVSKDSFNRKIRATASLVLPYNFNEKSGILAYPAWNDSPGKKCSLGYFHGGTESKRLNASLFSNVSIGLTEFYGLYKNSDMGILIPDANGSDMAFGANILSGQITLDSIRAVKNFRGYNNQNLANRKYGVYGYSGGGMMAAWTAVLEPTYAPDLKKNIVKYIAGGTPVDFVDLAEKYNFFNNKPKEEFGIAAALMLGLSREYDEFDIVKKLNRHGLQKFIESKDDCLTDMIGTFQDYSGAKILKSTNKSNFPNIIKIAKENSLTFYEGRLPIKPIEFWNAKVDTEIPQSDLVRKLVKEWKNKGVKAKFVGFDGDHKDLGFKFVPDTINSFVDLLRLK